MLLMAPGPVQVDPRVVAAMNREAITHQSAEFFQAVDDTIAMLRAIFQTESDVIIMPGSGRLGLEAALCSVLEPGDRTLHLCNGTFASFPLEIVRRCGAEPTVLEGRWGGPIDLDRVRSELASRPYKMVLVVHSETSTGARYPIDQVSQLCAERDVLCFVDAISSIGSIELNMDGMALDICVTASNKSLGSIIGLSMIGVSEKAFHSMATRKTPCHSWVLDLSRWRNGFFGAPAPRPFPVIPSTHLVFALREACRLALEEGMPARWQRHRRFAEATRSAVEAMGLDLFPDRELAAESVTAVKVPEGLEEKAILKRMREGYGVSIAGSMWGAAQGLLFRISHQGVQATSECLLPTLLALEGSLTDLGRPVGPGISLKSFAEALRS